MFKIVWSFQILFSNENVFCAYLKFVRDIIVFDVFYCSNFSIIIYDRIQLGKNVTCFTII